MQLLHGRGWSAFLGFGALAIGDVTGDGKAELTWFDTTPADHDRVIVSGDVAAITSVTTTTTAPTVSTSSTIMTPTTMTMVTTTIPTPPTVTTTTLPDCAAQSGLAGARCFSAPLAPAACGGATLPARITGGFGKARALLDRAATGTPKAQKKLLGKMLGRLGGAIHTASRKATVKKLPAGVRQRAPHDTLLAIRTDTRAARTSTGR